jgi:hypothetical protein
VTINLPARCGGSSTLPLALFLEVPFVFDAPFVDSVKRAPVLKIPGCGQLCVKVRSGIKQTLSTGAPVQSSPSFIPTLRYAQGVVRCPLCGGLNQGCRVCEGVGTIGGTRIEELAERISLVANAIQTGNANVARREARLAFRIAKRLLDREDLAAP